MAVNVVTRRNMTVEYPTKPHLTVLPLRWTGLMRAAIVWKYKTMTIPSRMGVNVRYNRAQ